MSRSSTISIRQVAAYGVGFLAVAWMYLKIVIQQPGLNYAEIALTDLSTLYYPLINYGFSELVSGSLPHWNPFQAAGVSLLADPSIGFFYPLYWLLLFVPAGIAIDIDLVFHLTVAATSMTLLCRHFAMHWGACILAGLIYAYQGGMSINFGYPSTLAFVAWIPLIYLFIARVFDSPTIESMAPLALVLGVSLLGGSVQHAYFTILSLIPFLLSLSWIQHQRPGGGQWASILSMLLLAGLLGAGLASVRLIPAIDFMSQTWRPGATNLMSEMGIGNNTREALLEGMLTPEPATTFWSDLYRRVYVGTLPLALALIGLLGWKQRWISLAIAAGGIAAAWYSLGPSGALYPIVFELPLGAWFRGPDRAFILAGFAVAFLSGAGFHYLLENSATLPGRKRSIVVSRALPIAAITLILCLQWWFGSSRGHTLAISYAVVGAALFCILWVTHSRRWVLLATLSLIGVVFFDLSHAQPQTGMRPAQLKEHFSRNNWLYEWIREHQEYARTHIWSPLSFTDQLRLFSDTGKAGSTHGIWQDSDYAVSGARYEKYSAKLGASPMMGPVGYRPYHLNSDNYSYFNLMGDRFAVFQKGQEETFVDPEILQRWHKRIEREDIVVYENSDALPRSLIVYDVDIETDAEQLLDKLGSLNLRTQALVEEMPSSSLASFHGRDLAKGNTRIESYSAHRVELVVKTSRAGFLVLTDQFNKNWKATIDGAPTVIYRANYLFRGVFVNAGTHKVVFVYDTSRFRIAAALSLFTLLVLLIMVFRVCINRHINADQRAVQK